MRRRKFLYASGLGALGALSGCLGSQSPPPRKSNVVTDFQMSDGSLVIDLADKTWVMSRYAPTQQSISGVSPIGVASAKGKGGGGGRGATGRGSGGYSSAPKTKHGHAWFHGGDYADDWYEDNADEVSRYSVGIATLGIAYLGSTDSMKDDAPDSGPVPWDKEFKNPDDTVTYDLTNQSEFRRDGWYRVGAHVVGSDVNHDFRWECYDLEVDNGVSDQQFNIEEQWKVSPRI
ncbi:hypothetical protein E6P09_18365 (plasmid) [Haloferax mediterranei ATCC 33500]|uniref:Uncharacterized protein n=1 Tax=Haloferax mediterranei (strain ATCC 33500 / DSM 1411 / JCM 8866 / NBRC 14739 / NCIMB 2177 / R-4) TaxID=523841 RepID=I3R9D1_HALMT|nr:hypothetical protein [Haloferax mediterranei]AFK20841.1 hypothetical protein HFX_5004 [Haloferax mediterranei ATCC 33500]AHZ24283.1 hypothetical protein BM92_18965 [Haloferax mediterranei ATCC 33500]EMA05367.1 hypothetical protein C439_01170 [Haloferax mediterranei ATCC 33500]MDX5989834.1 hypothetical protein [Haloferax mediterranei ATCC 33500]QCQ77277.1 hypothetical protein E6P09_18365 [Haloferax mediterranei ATCC 33500]